MEDVQQGRSNPASSSRFSVPAVVAGFLAPIVLWAISISGVQWIYPVTELLYVEYPFTNYDNEDIDDIEGVGTGFGGDEKHLYIRFTSLELPIVKAAANHKPDVDNKTWAYGGKRLSTKEVIAAMRNTRATYPEAGAQAVELNCFNQKAFDVQGAIFEFYIDDNMSVTDFNHYDPELTKRFDSFPLLTPRATQDDFSACLAFKDRVERELEEKTNA